MASHVKRSVLKTITWRITASLDTFVIAWVITGDWKLGGSIAGIEVLTKMFFYYFHERIWNKIKWGKKNGGNPKGLVRPERLELPWETPLGPQPSLSTSSSMAA